MDLHQARFDDRIEIWSTGNLPADMLGGAHKSVSEVH